MPATRGSVVAARPLCRMRRRLIMLLSPAAPYVRRVSSLKLAAGSVKAVGETDRALAHPVRCHRGALIPAWFCRDTTAQLRNKSSARALCINRGLRRGLARGRAARFPRSGKTRLIEPGGNTSLDAVRENLGVAYGGMRRRRFPFLRP